MKLVSFDLEIAKEVTGNDWKSFRPLGISCAALRQSDGRLENDYIYTRPTIDDDTGHFAGGFSSVDQVDLPAIPIVFITSTRTEYAIRTIESIIVYLSYDGRFIWHIAADNSNDNHLNTIKRSLDLARMGYTVQETTAGYGAAANKAWGECSSRGWPITFWLEDDWKLRRPLDITPDVKLLMELEHVGCVRYSYLPTGLECDVVGHHKTYLQIRKTKPYAFSGNPHLKHDRFGFYGAYPEGLNPGDTEIHYDGQIRLQPDDGPSIWWPLENGEYPGPFKHIGNERSY